jgi:DNA repair exonuclease SbcCD ATPase subunit
VTATKVRPAARDTAAATFLAKVARAAEGDPFDVDQELEPLVAATGLDGERLAAVRRAAGGVADQYRRRAEQNPDYAAAMARSALPAVIEALQLGLFEFDAADDLNRAEADLAELENASAAALQALEAAIQTAQFEAVNQLRGEIEIGFPSRLEAARLRVMDLRVAEARAAADPTAAMAAVQQVHDNAEQSVAHLKKQLAEAEGRRDAAEALMRGAREASVTIRRRANDLEEQRKQLAAEQAELRTARARRLAGQEPAATGASGLPPVAADRVVEPAAPRFGSGPAASYGPSFHGATGIISGDNRTPDERRRMRESRDYPEPARHVPVPGRGESSDV